MWVLVCLQALESLNKKDMTEIKSYGRPPPLVEKVMTAVMVLRNSEPTWAEAKKQLGALTCLSVCVFHTCLPVCLFHSKVEQGGLISVVFSQGGLSSVWSLFRTGLSSEWSHQGGLLIRVVSH